MTTLETKYKDVPPSHYLNCVQASGKSKMPYQMKCFALKFMSDNWVKIVLYGERFWVTKRHSRRIRYVDKSRLEKVIKPKKTVKFGLIDKLNTV